MGISIADNFNIQMTKPLDGRIKYDTLAAMKTMADSTLYDGCLAYCVATDKTYQWKSTNTVDTDTGKWREFTSGGETGDGHTIEDPEGTALTQRDTLQFGGDLEVSDDDENEKTVVTPHELTAAELAEIVTPLPSVPVNMPILFDETGTERVVGWYRLADGTKKPVYEKMLTGTTPSTLYTFHNIAIGASVDFGCCKTFVVFASNGSRIQMESYGSEVSVLSNTHSSKPNTFGYMVAKEELALSRPFKAVVVYTKTTDTPT